MDVTHLTVSGKSPLTRTCTPSLKSEGCTIRQLFSARVSLGEGRTAKSGVEGLNTVTYAPPSCWSYDCLS